MRRIISWTLLGVFFLIMAGIRFNNPHLTETELLIDFWPAWLVLLAVALIMMMVFNGS